MRHFTISFLLGVLIIPGYGCEDGASDADASGSCTGITCDSPPAAHCLDDTTLRTYESHGTCTDGVCDYAVDADTSCEYGCEDGACSPDSCAGITCDSPPAAYCLDESTLRTFEPEGTCTDGLCDYAVATDAVCEFGCEDGACLPDEGCVTPSHVEVVETGVPETGYREHFWSMTPSKVYAFRFRTDSGTEPVGRQLAAARLPGAVTGKRVVVSLCPDGPAISPQCTAFSAEATAFHYYTNVTEEYACVLEPDTVYHANVMCKYEVTDTGYNCGSATEPDTPSTECAFIYEQR